mgnify:CR=1 FL=1
MVPGAYTYYRFNTGKGLFSRGKSHRSLYVRLAFSSLLLAAAVLVGPLVLVGDLCRLGRRVPRLWVTGHLILCLLVGLLSWQVGKIVDRHREEAFRVMASYSKMRTSLEGTPYLDLILAYSIKHDLDPALVAALIELESNFDRYAVSARGARGLMQILPSTWRYINPESPCDGGHNPPSCGAHCIYEPEANIAAGCAYLKELFQQFQGDAVLAFAAYNAGPTAVAAYGDQGSEGGIPPFAETKAFVRGVLLNWVSKRDRPPLLVLSPEHFVGLLEIRRILPAVSLALWGILFAWIVAKL